VEKNHDLEDLLDEVEPPKPSITKRNKNKKTISVCNSFDLGRMPIKVIASYETWLEFENVYLRSGHIGLTAIRKYIYRPKKEILEKLEVYYAYSLQQFLNFFYNYYIVPANTQNPKWFNAQKPRGTYYGLDRAEMYKIRIASTQLYVYLKHWCIKAGPNEKRPDEFIALGARYQIHPKMLIIITWELIKKHSGIRLLNTEDEIIFYNNYIARQRLLRTFKMAFSRINYAPTRKADGTAYPPWAEPLLEVLEFSLKTPQK
jgi:hypothetical protein